jgi:hypothetical protein
VFVSEFADSVCACAMAQHRERLLVCVFVSGDVSRCVCAASVSVCVRRMHVCE